MQDYNLVPLWDDGSGRGKQIVESYCSWEEQFSVWFPGAVGLGESGAEATL